MWGKVDIKKFRPSSVLLQANLQEVDIPIEQGVNSKWSGRLIVQGVPEKLKVAGELKLNEFLFTRPLELVSVQPPKTTASSKLNAGSRSFGPIELDVTVTALDSIQIRTKDIKAVLHGKLQLQGTSETPILKGMFGFKEGNVKFRDTEFDVVRGSIKVDTSLTSVPSYDVLAETKIQIYTIYLNAFNDGGDNQLELSSNPELKKEDILTLLATGTLFDTEGYSDVDLSSWEIASFVSAPAQRLIEKELEKRTKLIQTFQIVSGYSDITNELEPILVVGSKLTDRFEMKYKATVTNFDEQQALLEYKLTNNLLLVGDYKSRGSNRDNELGMDIKVRFEFK